MEEAENTGLTVKCLLRQPVQFFTSAKAPGCFQKSLERKKHVIPFVESDAVKKKLLLCFVAKSAKCLDRIWHVIRLSIPSQEPGIARYCLNYY